MEKNPFNFFQAEFHSKYFGLLWVKLVVVPIGLATNFDIYSEYFGHRKTSNEGTLTRRNDNVLGILYHFGDVVNFDFSVSADDFHGLSTSSGRSTVASEDNVR